MIDLLGLIEFYNTYDQSDIFFEISKKMIENFTIVEKMGMQELADYLFVSTSTLYRFIKAMSYENHNQMKHSQQIFLENYRYSGRYISKEIEVRENYKEYGEYLCDYIRKITSELRTEKINKIVETMLAAETVIFIGEPMPSTLWRLQVELVLLGKKTSAFLNPQQQEDAVAKAGEKDCIFMVQYLQEEEYFYHEIARAAEQKGIPTILLSNMPDSELLGQVKYPISFEGEMCESDMLMITIILNIIGDQLNRKILEEKNRSKSE